jgi:hypothetical protein
LTFEVAKLQKGFDFLKEKTAQAGILRGLYIFFYYTK